MTWCSEATSGAGARVAKPRLLRALHWLAKKHFRPTMDPKASIGRVAAGPEPL
jgi:hypothetical protein